MIQQPLAGTSKPNTSDQYVAAWRHAHNVFRQERATNVRWVWSPNVANGSSTPFSKVYPGDAYVDWVALDGYNWGTTQSWSSWTSLANVFGPSYDALTRMTNKPIMIAEVGSAEAGGNKAAWIRQKLLKEISSRLPRVQAVVWFDGNKETDWLGEFLTRSAQCFQRGGLILEIPRSTAIMNANSECIFSNKSGLCCRKKIIGSVDDI